MASDVNFDITKNMILDSKLLPEYFDQITKSIFTKPSQCQQVVSFSLFVVDIDVGINVLVPSVVKAHFSWNWQCTTLTHGDELVNVQMPCIQPYSLFIPDYTTVDGWWSGHSSCFFGVLSLYHKTKTAKPGVSIILSCIISLPN